MRADFEIAGVYRIRNVLTGECYVGQARNIGLRWKGHATMLTQHIHHSSRLQLCYDLHGMAAFAFEVLEECMVCDLAAREAHWVEELKPALNMRLNEKQPAVVKTHGVCECGGPRDHGKRYCKTCEGLARDAMKADGYLTPMPRATFQRPREARELTHETKFGTGHG